MYIGLLQYQVQVLILLGLDFIKYAVNCKAVKEVHSSVGNELMCSVCVCVCARVCSCVSSTLTTVRTKQENVTSGYAFFLLT